MLHSGGMHLLGRTSDVLRGAEHYAKAEAACARFGLDGLVLVGGPVSNSDTALLAEHFTARGVATKVIGVPATIDGDLYNNGVEASIGFDTACRVYASLVGNLATDAASARKYWYEEALLEPILWAGRSTARPRPLFSFTGTSCA